MKMQGEMTLMRVHVRSSDHRTWHSPPAAQELVEAARQAGLAGATVLKGFFGLDIGGHLLESSDWAIVERLPVIVEVVDTPKAICGFLETVKSIVLEGLATLERAHVLIYRADHPDFDRRILHAKVPELVVPLSTLPSPKEFPAMKFAEDGCLVRIFIGEDDLWQGEPLYRVIVLEAKKLGLAGATVLKGRMGFGANSLVHTNRLVETAGDLPLVIEIIDSPEKIESLLPFVDEVVQEGLVTMESVRVLHYRHNVEKKP
jgi:uncharacterized protein